MVTPAITDPAADQLPMEMPTPPTSAEPKDMLKWMQSMNSWHKSITLQGVQTPFFSQSQMDLMAGQMDQVGKIFFNRTTGKFMCGELVGDNTLALKTITTS